MLLIKFKLRLPLWLLVQCMVVVWQVPEYTCLPPNPRLPPTKVREKMTPPFTP